MVWGGKATIQDRVNFSDLEIKSDIRLVESNLTSEWTTSLGGGGISYIISNDPDIE